MWSSAASVVVLQPLQERAGRNKKGKVLGSAVTAERVDNVTLGAADHSARERAATVIQVMLSSQWRI